MVSIFILQKTVAEEGRLQLFSICCNFGQIFCTEVIHFFSAVNMGYKLLKKRSKYEMRIFLAEKQRFSFARVVLNP